MATMNIILQSLFLIFITLKLTRCSRVLDKFNQDTIYVSAYCPKQKYCEEGSHVMCMYYDHDRKIGQRCKNFVDTEVTSQLVQQILDIVNQYRSRLATGIERGKDGLVLPRAYGMMKLAWDSELATLAQVLANQCLGGREDLCRATDKFPNPSQSIAIVQFRFPDWEYVRMNNTERGLTEEKLAFSIDRFLKSLHALRKTASREIIRNCPPFQELPDRHLRYYLNLIRGGATHIGCGLSAYTRYHDDGGRQSIRNSVQIVCNISDGPQPSQPVYATDPPEPRSGFTANCGCPAGYKDSEGCLCEVDPEYTSTTTTDASYHNLQSRFQLKKIRETGLKQRQKWMEIQHKAQTEPEPESASIPSLSKQCPGELLSNCEVKVVVLPILSIKDKPTGKTGFNNITIGPSKRVIEKYDLSDETFNDLTRALTMRPDYNHKSQFVYQKLEKKRKTNKSLEKLTHYTKSESMNKWRESVSTEENHDNNKQHSTQNDDLNDDEGRINVTNKDNDNKLLELLNVLEQEVKKVELNGNLRQLFDSKMRKIYGTALNTPRDQQQDVGKNIKDYLRNQNSSNNKNAKRKNESNIFTKDETVDAQTFVENIIKQRQNYMENRKHVGIPDQKYNNYADKSLINSDNSDQNAYEDRTPNERELKNDYNLNHKQYDINREDREIKYDDILDVKSVDHQVEDIDYPQEDTFVLRSQKNMMPYVNKDITEEKPGRKEYKNVNQYDNIQFNNDDDNNDAYREAKREEVEVNRRRMEDRRRLIDKYSNNLERAHPEKRAQITDNKSYRTIRHGNMRPMRQMRPNLGDVGIRPRFP